MPARDWLPAGGDAGASAWPAELGTLPLLKVPEILSVIDGSEPPLPPTPIGCIGCIGIVHF